MNYEANKTTWKIGDLVLHDCDAKTPEMLMRVVAYLPSGRVRAEYVDDEKRRQQVARVEPNQHDRGWFDLEDLHDPARFDVELSAAALDAAGDREAEDKVCDLSRPDRWDGGE